jgi:prepilin-type N-terminal cleavage/methylation domain-containing protein
MRHTKETDILGCRIKCPKKRQRKGFSLVEVVIGMAMLAIALLGLAQLFTYSVMSNSRAERMSNATFLAQQQIDFHRNLTADELNTLTGAAMDEQVDVNLDGTIDYRRITEIQSLGSFWEIRVLVFSAEQLNTAANLLTQDPLQYGVKANISTLISR